MPSRNRKPRNEYARHNICTFTVPKDDNGDFLLPPIRGWEERRRLVIEGMRRDLVALEKRTQWRRNPVPAVLELRRAIAAWQRELDGGIPAGDDEYGPLEIGGPRAA